MKKKSIYIVMLCLLIGCISFSYAETPTVTKIVFTDIDSSAATVGLGGLRFYNDNVLVESGSITTNETKYGETENFIVRVPSTYYVDNYNPASAVDTNVTRSGVGTRWYWLSEENINQNQYFEIQFKTPIQIDKMEYVTMFLDQPNNYTSENMKVEVHTSLGNVINYELTPSTTEEEVMAIDIIGPGVPLSTPDKVEKAFFNDIDSTATTVGLGGLRFYYKNVVVESGDIIANNELNGETDNMIVRSSTSIDIDNYYPVSAIDTSLKREGRGTRWYWLSEEDVNQDQTFEIEFKTPVAIDRFEYVTMFENQPNNYTSEIMPITIYLESGEVLNLNLQPSASEEEVINFDILDLVTSTVASSMTLESNVSQVSELDEFVVSVKIK